MTREELLHSCREELGTRRSRLESMLARLQNDRISEGKSSAGDKFETGLEMLKQEETKLGEQLGRIAQMEEQLHGLGRRSAGAVVAAGSVVRTQRGWFYLGVPLGKVMVNGKAVFCLSMASPLAAALNGRTTGEEIMVNGISQRIEEVG